MTHSNSWTRRLKTGLFRSRTIVVVTTLSDPIETPAEAIRVVPSLTAQVEQLRFQRLDLLGTRTWRKWLSPRKRGRSYPWERFARLLERYPLPAIVVVHSVYGRQ